ncbi:MAG: hypothetical protein IH598_04995 [Bacteroidales bacterium]|nr:hypothetical protein [Bacteroidales bacterium]
MNTREIEKLLDRYFEAETSQEEEQLLKQFFLSDNVPAHLQQHIPLFRFANSERTLSTKSDVETFLMKKIEQSKRVSFKSRRMWYVVSGVAASVLLLLTIITETRQTNVVADRNYSPEEIQLAWLQTKEVLAYTSGKINRGTDPLGNVSKINSGASAINQLGKLDEGMTQLNQGLKRIDGGVDHLSKFSKFNLLTNQ